MRAFITTYEGKRYELPQALAYRFDYACGTPCDSFWMELPFRLEDGPAYEKAVRLTAQEGSETVFTGVVDEAEWGIGAGGSRVTLSGRSMAALLLDNEAQPMDYAAATLKDILHNHVTPYGLAVVGGENIPSCQGFSVAGGQSEWQVLYEFARYHGGVPPRVDRAGRLVLAPFGDEKIKVLGDEMPVSAITRTEKRYGVLSEVLVWDRKLQSAQRLVDGEFSAQGGRRRRVVSGGGGQDAKAARYSAQFQMNRSKAERRTVSLQVPRLFFAWPGELIRLDKTGWGGTWRVLESGVAFGEQGGSTTLKLGAVDAVI